MKPLHAPLTFVLAMGLVATLAWPLAAMAQTPAPQRATAAGNTAQTPQRDAQRPRQRLTGVDGPVRRVVPVTVAEPELPLTEAELAVAEQVHVGELPCELGNNVRLERDLQNPGHFRLSMQKLEFRMRPVISRTGAVRLEDRAQGAVWIQLANKSMLMSQQQGRRLADECAGDAQRAVAEALKLNPAPSLLDAPTPTR